MRNSVLSIPEHFVRLVNEIPHIGLKKNAKLLLDNVQACKGNVAKSIAELPPLQGEKAKSGIIISAGPSVKRQRTIERIMEANYKGTVIAVDGSYISCIKAGLYPDYLLTLDPYGSRVVRWFGDHDFEKHTLNDDYYVRQDLDVDFRKNSIAHNKENIELVNKYGYKTKAIVATSAHQLVIKRIKEARFDTYWWNPLTDNPRDENSLTRQFYNINGLPCMTTGGTVGTSAWVFAATRINLPVIALTGVCLGYYHDTPLEQTQLFYELLEQFDSREEVKKYYIDTVFPLTGEKFYTDPTYYWYKINFIDMLKRTSHIRTYNCTEAGTLVDEAVPCIFLTDFLEQNTKR